MIETYLILKSKSKIVLLDEPFSHLSPLYIEQTKANIEKDKVNKDIIIADYMYRHIFDAAYDIYLLKNGCTKNINNLKELENYNYLSVGSLA